MIADAWSYVAAAYIAAYVTLAVYGISLGVRLRRAARPAPTVSP